LFPNRFHGQPSENNGSELWNGTPKDRLSLNKKFDP